MDTFLYGLLFMFVMSMCAFIVSSSKKANYFLAAMLGTALIILSAYICGLFVEALILPLIK